MSSASNPSPADEKAAQPKRVSDFFCIMRKLELMNRVTCVRRVLERVSRVARVCRCPTVVALVSLMSLLL